MKILRLLGLLLTLGAPLQAQGRGSVVLNALPEIQTIATSEYAQREVLDSEGREMSRILIVKEGGTYFWVTRENRELIYRPGPVYHTFIDPLGGGWVRVLDQRTVPVSLREMMFSEEEVFPEGQDIGFFENVSTGLTTITYWGTTSDFDP